MRLVVVARLVPVKLPVERVVSVLNDVVVAADVTVDVPNVVVVLNEVAVDLLVPRDVLKLVV